MNKNNRYLNINKITEIVRRIINNNDYNFEIINNDLIVSDEDRTITLLSNKFLTTHNLNDIIYNIKVAMLINEINVRHDNYCLDDEQVDAMLNIVTGLNY